MGAGVAWNGREGVVILVVVCGGEKWSLILRRVEPRFLITAALSHLLLGALHRPARCRSQSQAAIRIDPANSREQPFPEKRRNSQDVVERVRWYEMQQTGCHYSYRNAPDQVY